MSRFVLTAQLQLQAPNNVGQIVQQIQNQLNGVTVNVQVQNSRQAQRQIQQVTQATNQATTAAERMGRAFALSVRRFAAFSVATRAVSLFTSNLGNAVQDAIDFERQLIKVAQVTGKSVSQLRGLTKQITNLSTGFGVASSDLLEVSTVLAQAGLSAEDTAVALKTLAKAALAPNFDSITETAEGAIAILAQFQQGVGALEAQLGSINAVAGAFAVEASDLIDVIRRTGGVFKASGGSLNELLALFTSVRATTRESAESIGTGLRTIFTRIQRPKTIEFLKQFGVELVDLNGKFVGPYEAIKRLSEALSGLGEGDLTFISIAEELGGFRQIGKVLPLLQQFSTAQQALNVAMRAGDSLTQDAASAQAALAIRVMKVKEEFLALIRSITETPTFQIMANTALSLASALIKIGDAIKPLLPMLAAVAAIRLTRGIGGFFGGIMSGATSGRTYNKGGKVLGFARGGLVPGTGNRDTVPAMLSPGEFVIRQSSVRKMGAGTLAAMNENRYKYGGVAEKIAAARNQTNLSSPKQTRDISTISTKIPPFAAKQSIGIATASYLPSPVFGSISFDRDQMLNQQVGTRGQSLIGIFGDKAVSYFNKIFPSGKGKGFSYPTTVEGIGRDKEGQFKSIIDRNIGLSITNAANDFANSVLKTTLDRPITILPNFYDSIDKGFRGNFFENVISALNGKPLRGSDTQRPFDFTKGLGSFKNIYGNLPMNYVDARISASSAGVGAGSETQNSKEIFTRKAQAQLADELFPQMLLLQKQSEALKKQSSAEKVTTQKSKSPRQISSIDTNKLNSFASGQIYKDTDIASAGIQPAQYRQGFDRIAPGRWRRKYFGGIIQKFATGGNVGTDTVPALLTPGEFVVNRSSAQRIGYGALNRMNKVGKYAKGGVVQHFAGGGGVTSKSVKSDIAGLSGNQSIQQEIAATAKEIKKTGDYAKRVSGSLDKQAKVTDTLYKESAALDARISNYDRVLANLAAQQGKAAATGTAANRIVKMKIDAETQRIEVDKKAMAEEQKLEGIKKKHAATVEKQTQLMDKQTALIAQAKSNKQAATQLVQQPLTGGTKTNFKDADAKLARESEYARVRANKDKFTRGSLGGGMMPKDIGGAAIAISMVTASLQAMLPPLDENSSALTKMSHGLLSTITTIAGVVFALQAFGVELKAQSLKKFFGIGDIAGGGFSKRGLASMRGGMMDMGFSRGFATQITGVTQAITSVAAPLLAVGAAALAGAVAFRSMYDSMNDFDGRLKSAIDKGDVEKAKSVVAEKNGFQNQAARGAGTIATAAAFGAAMGSVIPIFGTLGGAIIGTVVGSFMVLYDSIGDSVAQQMALAAAQAGAVKTQKALEEAQKTATKAMEDFKNGSISASDALTQIRAKTSEVSVQQKRTSDLVAANSKDRSATGFTSARNWGAYLGGGLFGMETSATRNKRLSKDNVEQINQVSKFQAEAFNVESEARQATIRSGIARGKNTEEIRSQAMGNLSAQRQSALKMARTAAASGDDATYDAAMAQAKQLADQMEQVNREVENIEKAVKQAKESFQAMNLGLRSAQATSSALSASMTRFSEGFEVGGASVMSDVKFLQEAMSSAAQAMNPKEIQDATSNIAKNLRAAGVSEGNISKFEGNVKAFTQAQAGYNKAFANVKKSMAEADFQNLNPDELKKRMGEELTKGLGPDVSKEAKENLKKAIGGMELSTEDVDKILGGDLGVFGEKLGEEQKKMFEPIMKIMADRAAAEQVLIDFTKKRIEAERNLVAAQQEALDLRMEGREVQAKYGGPAVSMNERRANLLAKSNAESNRLGLTGLKTGSIEELRQRNSEIKGKFAGIESRKTERGGMDNAAGATADENQKDLQKAYKTQIDTIRGLIKLEEEQLKITQEKNKLEKESMESLIKGDVESFFKQQAAVGATAAIASGSTRLQSYYGADALGMAYQDIQRQQEAGVQELYGQRLAGAGGLTEAAAGAALSARGVTDMRAAQVMAGTTAEEEASKSRLRELGGMLGETGQLGVELAEMQVNTSVVNITAAQAKFDETIARGNAAAGEAKAAENMPVTLARGGMVYASRGIFVPRGTDTIPAMLTPGEFVVNRGAVQRGNNLQILQAMNGGSNMESSGGTATMSRGGQVRYLSGGSETGEKGGGLFGNMSSFITSLASFGNQLSESITKLTQTNIKITLDSTNVNINLNDGGLLKALTGQVQDELFKKIESEFKVEEGGRLKRSNSILGK